MRHDYILKSGAQKQNITVFTATGTVTTELIGADTASTVPNNVTYYREGATADVDITLTTTGVAVGTYVSSGWIAVDATNSPGLIQLGVPDAALKNGAKWVDILIHFADGDNREDIHVHIDLVRSVAW